MRSGGWFTNWKLTPLTFIARRCSQLYKYPCISSFPKELRKIDLGTSLRADKLGRGQRRVTEAEMGLRVEEEGWKEMGGFNVGRGD